MKKAMTLVVALAIGMLTFATPSWSAKDPGFGQWYCSAEISTVTAYPYVPAAKRGSTVVVKLWRGGELVDRRSHVVPAHRMVEAYASAPDGGAHHYLVRVRQDGRLIHQSETRLACA